MASWLDNKAAKWMRTLSERLENSYGGSASIQQTGVKGQAREWQVLDVLDGLLPRGVAVGRDVTVVDSQGSEAADFDGVIYDRIRFPVLYYERAQIGSDIRTKTVALLESILVCLETKSNLDKHELEDTIRKIQRLESLRSVDNSTRPPVLLFAYKADNPNLSFVDYCAAFSAEPIHTPNLVCILNKGLFMAAKRVNDIVVPSLLVEDGSYPVFAQCGKEALLLTYFLVAKQSARSPEIARILEAYVQKPLQNVPLFSFEPTFVSRLPNQEFRNNMRRKFFRTANRPINEVYAALTLR